MTGKTEIWLWKKYIEEVDKDGEKKKRERLEKLREWCNDKLTNDKRLLDPINIDYRQYIEKIIRKIDGLSNYNGILSNHIFGDDDKMPPCI